MSPREAPSDIGRLLVTCADRPGIIAAVSAFLREQGANIAHSDHHSTDLKLAGIRALSTSRRPRAVAARA